jgi:hypothetical protein
LLRADIPIAERDASDSAVLIRRKMGSLICRSENVFATKQQAVEELNIKGADLRGSLRLSIMHLPIQQTCR